jgi:hypothetical protein
VSHPVQSPCLVPATERKPLCRLYFVGRSGREPRHRCVPEGLGGLGQLIGLQWADDELAVVVEAGPTLAGGEHRLDGLQGCLELLAQLVEAGSPVGGDASELTQLGAQRWPPVGGR